MRGSPPECAEMVQEILLKLPTRDVARSCCVSKLWRSVVNHPSFRSLHAEANQVSGASEALFISETNEPGRPAEVSVFNVSSAKAMCRRVAIPSGYSLANVCNGLLCFAIGSAEAPPVACNPITGETVALPKAPPLTGIEGSVRHLFALGFSPSTKEHKLFRLSFPCYSSGHGADVHQSVYTLDGGGTGGWRQRSYRSPSRPLCRFPPELVDGKLYMVTSGWRHYPSSLQPDGILAVDVATEAHHTYGLPYGEDEHYSARYDPMVSTFEMDRRLCLAVMSIINGPRRRLQFWVMSPPPEHDHQVEDDKRNPCWHLRYSFYVDDQYAFNWPRGAWFEDGEMTLCYRHGDVLYKHGTRGRSPDADCLPYDRRLQLPPTPSKYPWMICGGYRPSLLLPLALAPPPS